MLSHASSRRRVFGVVAILAIIAVICTAYGGGILAFEYRFAGGWWGVGFVVVIYGLAFLVRRGLKRNGNAITLSLGSTAKPSVRLEILAQRTLLATLVNRAAFEVGRAHGLAAQLVEGHARARELNRLRKEGLWDGLAQPLRDMLALPEGAWSEQETGRVLLHLEAVNVLSWAIEQRFELAPLRTSHEVRADVIRKALDEGDPVRSINFLRKESEIDAELGPTRVYLARLQSELAQRGAADGDTNPELDENAGAYTVYAVSVGEADVVAEDLPIGGNLIREAPTQDLLQLRGRAAVRFITLEGVRQAVLGNGVGTLAEVAINLAPDFEDMSDGNRKT
jgi:hypothetical protein